MRVRLRVRTVMLAIALVAGLLGATAAMERRVESFKRLAAADGRRKARQMTILRPFRGIRGARPRQPWRGPVTLNAQRTELLGRGAS